MFENFTIRQYIKAKFQKDFSEMTKEQFDQVEAEYIDTTGLFISEEFDKIGYINFLTGRINSVKLGLKLHRDFIEEFGVVYKAAIMFFQKFGYYLNPEDTVENILKELTDIENSEKRYTSELEMNIKQLKDMQKKSQTSDDVDENEELTLKKQRGNFIRTINSLGKVGYKIDNDKTTMEEVAYMVKSQIEEYEASKNR